MTERTALRLAIETTRVIAIVRGSGRNVSEALDVVSSAGLDIAEISLTTPGALNLIGDAVRRVGDGMVIGAGTVLDETSARMAIDAGARFLVTPNLDRDCIACANRYGVAVLAGVATATEAVQAMSFGATYLKLFPAERFGPRYIKDLRGPLPQLDVVPTGGITADNASDYLAAGAVAVAVGGSLINDRILTDGDWPALERAARRFADLRATKETE